MKRKSGNLVWRLGSAYVLRLAPPRLRRSLLFNSFVISGILSFNCDHGFAQITPDNTLGDESSVVNTRDATSDSIDGGAIRGQNLFHSFEEFNVGEDRGVYFANPNDVTNIFSRVTGNDVSDILGTLGVDGAANLFLINPNGIVFGEDASLDVNGSFAATTADGIEFGEQGFFSAVNPESPKLLTIDPSAYLFNQVAPGAIANSSQASADSNPSASFDDDFFGLRVPDDQNLLLLGGDVSADGGGLVASGGRIDLGAVTGQGVIGLNNDGSLNIPDSVARGNVSLINGAGFLVAGDGGGDLAIAAKNISLDSASTIEAGIYSNLGSPDAQAGDLNLNATGTISVKDDSYIVNNVFADATGTAGNLTINTNDLIVSNGGQIGAGTFGQGDGGNLTVRASNIELEGASSDGQFASGLFTTIEPQAQGNGGNLTINTDNLSLGDRAQVSASTFGQGDAGNLAITVDDTISLDATSAIINNVQDINAVGDAGKIDITTGSLSAKKGSQINSFTLGQGNAGDITIQARDAVTFDGSDGNDNYSSASSTVEAGAKGDGGNINITASSLSLTNGGELNVRVREASDSLPAGTGDGGNVSIDVDDTLTIAGENTPRIIADLGAGAKGSGGDINIQTGNLAVKDGGSISASTLGQGDSGNLSIAADNSISLDDSLIVNNVQDTNAVGDAGKIEITTGSLSAKKGSQINSFTLGQGNAGDITIQARNAVTFNGFGSNDNYSGASSNVQAGGVGDGGNVKIEADSLALTNGGKLDASIIGAFDTLTGGKGEGGNVNVNVDDTLTITGENAQGIFASLGTGAVGSGGDIDIQTGKLVVEDGGTITASTLGKGDSGNISITADNSISLNDSNIFNNVQSIDAVGDAGKIDITTGSLSATKGSQITSFTRGQGNARDITIQATDSVTFDGFGSNDNYSGAFSGVEAGGVGNGGNINITVSSLSLTNGGQINASTLGKGDSGNLSINADNLISLDASGIFNNVEDINAVGDAGKIEITTGYLSVTNGSQINSFTRGQGNAGNIIDLLRNKRVNCAQKLTSMTDVF